MAARDERDSTWDERARHETAQQRLDRNWAELLQELRVAQTGVQILFAGLLSIPFQQRFSRLSDLQRDVYLATLLLAAGAVVALIGPVAYHRAVFRQHVKGRLVATAGRMAVVGLVLLGLAIVGAVLLVTDVLLGGLGAGIVTAAVALAFVLVWAALPLAARRAAEEEPGDADDLVGGG